MNKVFLFFVTIIFKIRIYHETLFGKHLFNTCTKFANYTLLYAKIKNITDFSISFVFCISL